MNEDGDVVPMVTHDFVVLMGGPPCQAFGVVVTKQKVNLLDNAGNVRQFDDKDYKIL